MRQYTLKKKKETLLRSKPEKPAWIGIFSRSGVSYPFNAHVGCNAQGSKLWEITAECFIIRLSSHPREKQKAEESKWLLLSHVIFHSFHGHISSSMSPPNSSLHILSPFSFFYSSVFFYHFLPFELSFMLLIHVK